MSTDARFSKRPLHEARALQLGDSVQGEWVVSVASLLRYPYPTLPYPLPACTAASVLASLALLSMSQRLRKHAKLGPRLRV